MPPGVPIGRAVSALAALAVVAAGLVVPGVAQAAPSPAVTLTVTPTSVASGAPVELKASMPVRDDTGTVSQEIVQTIDPTKVRLTAATDIVAPQGWALSYSFDSGATWTSTAPTSSTGTATSWDRVTAVKASGSLVTDGSDAGRQVASANVSGPVQSLAPATLQSTVGDGYQAFFDPARTRVFNVYHHTSRSLDCWVIQTGAKCAGFPFAFGLGTDTSQTLNRSTARVVGNKVWISGYGGLYCVDIAAVLATTQSAITNKALTANVATLTTSEAHGLAVGATVAVSGVGAPFDGTYVVTSTPTPTTFTYAKTNANVAAASASGRVGGVPANCATPKVALRANGQYSVFAGAATSGESSETKLYAVDGKGGGTRISCIDTATMTSCGEMDTGWGPSATPSGQNSESIVKWGNQVYVSQVKLSSFSPYTIRVTCFVVTTGQLCSGWSSPYDFRTDNTRAGGDMTWLAGGQLFALPDASGQTRAVCWARPTTTASDPIHCWTTSSTPVNGRTTYGLPQFSDSWNTFDFAIATTQGSRVYVGDANYTTTTATKVYCYDAAATAGAGGKCNNRDLLSTKYNNYTVTPDPLIPDCLWLTRHNAPVISTVNILNDTDGCGSLAPIQVTFSGTTSVPRMGCSDDSAIAQWRSFTLNTPTTGYTSLRLTVQDSNGVVIPGWDDTVISATVPKDLSGLSVSLTGQRPNFIVRPVGISGSVTATAQIKAVGDSPELCLTPLTIPPCPAASVLVNSANLFAATTAPVASGSTTPGGALQDDSATFTIQAPAASQCGSTLTGRAGDDSLGAAGVAVSGMLVALLDDTGNPLLDDSLNPIRATTDATGAYSFGFLAPGRYRVSFPSTGAASSSSSTVVGGATVSAVSGTSTSAAVVLAVGTNGVVNGLYVRQPVARANSSLGGQGVAQSISPLADDSASTGATYSGGSTALTLCGASESYPSCAQSSLVVTGPSGVEGRYTVSGTSVSFQPCKASNDPAGIGCTGAFTGVASPVTYQSTDSLGRKASSTITSTVVPAPVAVDDTSTGAWSTAQAISPLANDTTSSVGGTPYPLLASTMGICAGSVTLASSCTGTAAVTTVDGSYSLNTSTGVVTFTPLSTFTGVVTAPIKYAAADLAGQRVIKAITPTVTAPPSPVAAPETKSVAAGGSVSFTTVTGAGGLGTSGGPPLSTSLSTAGTNLCSPSTSPPQTPPNCTVTTVIISGEGTYSLDRATGVVTYTALAGATAGSKTPVRYQIKDTLTSGGRIYYASALLTPFIPGPPVARDDTVSTAWDVPVSVNVLGNDSVDAGQSLVASSVRLCGAGDVSPACDDTVVTTAQGTYTVNLSTGAVSFDPLPTFWGPATPIPYTVTDSQGLKDPATLTVTVAAPGLPVATDDTVLVAPGGSAGFAPLIGAGGLSSSGGPALVSACLWVSGACDGDGVVTVNSGGGVYVLDDTTKVVTFHACTAAGVPHASCAQALSGQPAAVTYRVTDAVGQADTGVLTARVPVAPVSRDDSSMAEAGATQVITPLGNDQAGDAALNVASLKLCRLSPAQTPPNCDQTSVTTAAGTYTVSGGAVTFVPADDAPGTDVDVRYQVADVFGQTSSAVIRVMELPKPAPRAAPNAASGPYGQSLTFSPLADDTYGTVPADDSTNNVLTQVLGTGWLSASLKLCGQGQAPPGCDKSSVTTADGTYVISGTEVVFTGNAAFTGVATQPVMYQVANTYTVRTTDYSNAGQVTDTPGSRVGSSTITPTITVAPVVAVPNTASTPWNTPVSESVLADDTSGAAINSGALKLCGPADAGVCAQTSVTVAGQGTFEVVGSQVRFTPLPGFSGAVDSVTYRTTDALGRPISSTFTPTVAAPNGPTALPEGKAVLAGGSVAFTTLAESGPLVAPGVNSAGTNAVQDGSTCLWVSGTCDADGVVATADGTYVLNALTGVVTYTADPDAPAGPQVPVSYRVVDSIGLTAIATLTPTVYARPVVQAKARTDVMNLDQVFTVLADDTHDPATTILASSVRLCGADDTSPDCTQMSRTLTGVGVFTVDPATGAITFNPDDTYVGAVPAVTYSVDDTLGQRTSATLTPTVVAHPKPAAVNDTGSANSGSPIVFRPWTNDDTIDGPRGASVTTATLVPTSIQLCGPGDVPLPAGAGCDDTTVVTVDGTYVLDPATGTVVFNHAPGFTGTASAPVTYQITTDYTINTGAAQYGYDTAQLIPTINAPAPGGGTPPGGGGGTPPGGGGGGGGTPSPSPSPSPSPGPGPVTEPDGGVGRPGEPVRVDPIGNDSPGQGQVFDEGSLRLCPAGSTPPDCEGLVVQTDQGTWVVDPFTGAVVFTPVPGFEGMVEIPYVVTTEDGQLVDSVITVWITDPPAAQDDTSSGRVDRPQTLDPWTNDAHDAAPWDRGSLALCGAGQTPPGCDQSRAETADGVYEIDPVTGKVVFTPAPGFTGTATPIQYQVTDAAGQVAHAWLRPTVRAGGPEPEPEPEPEPGVGWLTVRKVVTGNELRAGAVMIVTTCRGGGAQQRRVHRLPVTSWRGVWRVTVPAGMRCQVAETAHGAPQARGVSPTWRDRRWAVDHTPTVAVGQRVEVGAAVPIDKLILSTKGGCQVRAGVLEAIAVGTCTITWRVPKGQVTTSTRWTHVGPRGTRVEAGTLTRAFVVRDGAETQVTFHNRYRTQDQTVTRTVYVTPQCPTATPKQAAWTAPWASPQAMAAYAPRGGPSDPGTCPGP